MVLREGNKDWAVALGIAVLAAVPYLAAGVSDSFISLDDPSYITANPQVLQGLTAASARWALAAFHASNWHPLTWLSHLLDVTLFGLDARGHHAANLLLHALNTGLLFLVLRRMTGSVGRSAFVAALFGVHPLHVESVAWVAERKDVLSGLFFMLVLLAWERYARRGGGWRYGAALGLFALGLTAKPMLVTVPFVLLLFDVWPLGHTSWPRGQGRTSAGWGALLLEKVPFLALATASSAATVLAQGEAVKDLQSYPLAARLANALVSYVSYLGTTLWPARLAVFYPYPLAIPWPASAAAALLLALVSFAAFRRLSVQPYLAVGWCWFVGMLVPVIGLIQVGSQARADRYTYLPLIGLFLGVTWLAAEGLPAALRRARVLGPLAAGVVAACAATSAVQAGSWRDSETLYRRTLAVTKDNWLIRSNLAAVLNNRGQLGEALAHGSEAVRLVPGYAEGHINFGSSLAMLGRQDEAVAQFREAIRIRPNVAVAHSNLGASLAALGRHEEAVAEYLEALRIEPGYAQAHNHLGLSLAALRRHEEAAVQYREAIRIAPGYAEAHNNLGFSLSALGRFTEATQAFSEAAQLSRRGRAQ